jgi:excisionase family DNA binding protein
MGDAVVTLNEAAEQLGVTPDTLRQQIKAGKLDAEKRGRDWWVTPRAVERYRSTSLGKRGRRAKEKG